MPGALSANSRFLDTAEGRDLRRDQAFVHADEAVLERFRDPERAAEINVNEGVCEIFDVVFPPKGTLITPIWPAPRIVALWLINVEPLVP